VIIRQAGVIPLRRCYPLVTKATTVYSVELTYRSRSRAVEASDVREGLVHRFRFDRQPGNAEQALMRTSYGDGVPVGELIGRGASSEVYAWTADTVIELFVPHFEALAAVEFERTRVIRAAKAPCPGVHEMVEVDGRAGVVFDRLAGPALLAKGGAAAALAHLHAE
jgi:hypothetical protein